MGGVCPPEFRPGRWRRGPCSPPATSMTTTTATTTAAMIAATFTQRGLGGGVGSVGRESAIRVLPRSERLARGYFTRQIVSVKYTPSYILGSVPKLWSKTIEDHRKDVREAIAGSTVALVAAHGLRSVTMAQIASETGIGRATLYKYFPDVESILHEWHDRQIRG